jgi:hypothetical protein
LAGEKGVANYGFVEYPLRNGNAFSAERTLKLNFLTGGSRMAPAILTVGNWTALEWAIPIALGFSIVAGWFMVVSSIYSNPDAK